MLSKLLIYVFLNSVISQIFCDDILLEEGIDLMMDTFSPFLTSSEISRSAKMSINDFKNIQTDELKSDPESKLNYIEGDMMMDRKKYRRVLFVAQKWPNARIPYILETQFSPLERHAISRGIITIEKKTCVKFVPKQKSDNDFVHIRKGQGCGAHVGKRGGRQLIILGRGCFNFDTVIHELMHSLGFIHEQSRPDRDLYVSIHWNNIKSGREREFRKHKRDYFYENGFPYDLLSVMHYREYAFSKNRQKTITPKKPVPHLRCKALDCPTDLDVMKINQFYKCFNKKKNNFKNTNTESLTNIVINDEELSVNDIFESNEKLINDNTNKTFSLSETQSEVNAIEGMLSTLTPNTVLEENNLEK